jgi:hypothetical protein
LSSLRGDMRVPGFGRRKDVVVVVVVVVVMMRSVGRSVGRGGTKSGISSLAYILL